MEKIKSAAHYKEVAEQIKRIDDVREEIEAVDRHLSHMNTTARQAADAKAIDRVLAGEVETIAEAARDMMGDTVANLLHKREQLDEAAREWESFECYGDLERKYAGSCIA